MRIHFSTLLKNGITTLLVSGLLIAVFAPVEPARAEACSQSALDTSYGSVSQTVTVASSLTYHVWSRLKAPADVESAYYLVVDNACPILVSGGTPSRISAWHWIGYRDADPTAAVTVDLTAGQHTFQYIGKVADVMLDRVITLSDQDCIPQDFGDNCSIVDTTPPLVSLVDPHDGDDLKGSMTLHATAYDLTTITGLDYYLDDVKIGSGDPANAYAYQFDTTQFADGTHNLQAKATDSADPPLLGKSSIIHIQLTNNVPPVVSPTEPAPSSPPTATPAPSSPVVDPPSSDTMSGLRASYYDNPRLMGSPLLTQTDDAINYDWGDRAPAAGLPSNMFSARWTGFVSAPQSGVYRFYVSSDDGIRLSVNKRRIISHWTDQSVTTRTGSIRLIAGKKYPISLDYYERFGLASVKLEWSSDTVPRQIVPASQLFLP